MDAPDGPDAGDAAPGRKAAGGSADTAMGGLLSDLFISFHCASSSLSTGFVGEPVAGGFAACCGAIADGPVGGPAGPVASGTALALAGADGVIAEFRGADPADPTPPSPAELIACTEAAPVVCCWGAETLADVEAIALSEAGPFAAARGTAAEAKLFCDGPGGVCDAGCWPTPWGGTRFGSFGGSELGFEACIEGPSLLVDAGGFPPGPGAGPLGEVPGVLVPATTFGCNCCI